MKHKFFERRLPCRSPLSRVLRAGLVLGAVCCLVLALGSCGGQTETETAPHSDLPVILVGSDNYPPFHYEDANGQPTGIDVDLAKEAFRRMGYQAVFVTIDWEDKKDLVERGEIDCIWGSFSIDGREDQYLWTEPYLYSRQVVAVRQDSDIQTLADLAGKRVAVQSTTKPEELFLAHTDPRIPRVAEVFSLQDRELIYPYLSKGYADALAAHETAILQCMSDYSLDYRILDEPLLTVGLVVAFARTDQRGLDKELSRTFEEMRADGSLEQIVGRYLDEPQRLLEVTP
ncbi:MAG: ABC transporter substrate-binding protein [Evtepia sp.]